MARNSNLKNWLRAVYFLINLPFVWGWGRRGPRDAGGRDHRELRGQGPQQESSTTPQVGQGVCFVSWLYVFLFLLCSFHALQHWNYNYVHKFWQLQLSPFRYLNVTVAVVNFNYFRNLGRRWETEATPLPISGLIRKNNRKQAAQKFYSLLVLQKVGGYVSFRLWIV